MIERDAPATTHPGRSTAAITVRTASPAGRSQVADRERLSVGSAGALRRSELAGILRANLERTEEGSSLP